MIPSLLMKCVWIYDVVHGALKLYLVRLSRMYTVVAVHCLLVRDHYFCIVAGCSMMVHGLLARTSSIARATT